MNQQQLTLLIDKLEGISGEIIKTCSDTNKSEGEVRLEVLATNQELLAVIETLINQAKTNEEKF